MFLMHVVKCGSMGRALVDFTTRGAEDHDVALRCNHLAFKLKWGLHEESQAGDLLTSSQRFDSLNDLTLVFCTKVGEQHCVKAQIVVQDFLRCEMRQDVRMIVLTTEFQNDTLHG